MRKFRASFLSFGVLLVVLVGCTRTAPILNIASDNFVSPSQPLAERAMEIKRAGVGLGWTMEEVGPGKIKATLDLRTHQAIAMISYTDNMFSIQYVDSKNLDYSGTVIHKNYNSWIQNLDRAIKAQSSI